MDFLRVEVQGASSAEYDSMNYKRYVPTADTTSKRAMMTIVLSMSYHFLSIYYTPLPIFG